MCCVYVYCMYVLHNTEYSTGVHACMCTGCSSRYNKSFHFFPTFFTFLRVPCTHVHLIYYLFFVVLLILLCQAVKFTRNVLVFCTVFVVFELWLVILFFIFCCCMRTKHLPTAPFVATWQFLRTKRSFITAELLQQQSNKAGRTMHNPPTS